MGPKGKDGGEGTAAASYSSDQPIASKAQDRFNRWPFAKRIAETLSARRDPSSLVIGVYGAWGEGKTSVLAMMREALASDPHIVTISFNPWHFGSDEHLLRSFFKTLAKALGKSVSTKLEKIGGLLDRYGAILSAASVTVEGVKLDPGNAAKGVGMALSAVELDTLKERIEQILHSAGKRVVVLIDDIDRLDRHEIQTIFKLVKLSANFECTSYVLAFDDQMVAEALGEKYGGGGIKAGRAFLEKIVQVPLNLPPADQLSLLTLTFEGIEGALKASGIDPPEEQVEKFVHRFTESIAPRLTTPRQANLYVNALTFALPIMKGEVDPIDQMFVEGIRVFYPKLYAAIRDHGADFLRLYRSDRDGEAALKPVKELIDASLEETDPSLRKKIRELLDMLFPRLKSGHDGDWDSIWRQAKRICSDAYFERYFRYGVPADDISDVAVETFLAVLKDLDESQTVERFKELSTIHNSRRLIQKIRRLEHAFSVDVATRLVIAVVRNGSRVRREKAMVLSDWTFMQAAILVAHVLKRVPEGDARETLARRALAEADPLPFAVECVKWMRRSKEDDESDRLLPDAVLSDLWALVARRIGTAGAQTPLYETFGRDASVMYWIWNTYGGVAGEVAKHLQERFDANSAEVDQFLSMFVGTSWDLETGHPSRSEFDRDDYNKLASLIDPDVVLAKLRERFGSRLDRPRQHHSVSTPLRDRFAEQFAFVHKAVTAEKAAAANDSAAASAGIANTPDASTSQAPEPTTSN